MASTCDKSFCTNYMILKPEEATFLDICKILFSDDIGKRKFVECPNGVKMEPLGSRWIIFLSILIQKLLHDMAKPMSWLGVVCENWLNLLSGNGGFFRLAINSIRGNVIFPDKSSASFLSLTGNSDNRLDLDSKNSDSNGGRGYHALLSLMASKASYENKNYIQSLVNGRWKMNFLGFYDFWNDYQEKATTQAFVVEDKKDLLVVAFRGTEPFDADAWISDVDLSWYELPGVGRVHGGFMKALGLQKSLGWPKNQPNNKPETAYYAIRKLLKERMKNNENARFIVTGHSLGGALAVLFPAILGMHGESWLLQRLEGVYTFGQPRVGDENFAEFMKKIIKNYNINNWYRFVYSFDIVPRLPYDNSTFMFKHFGTCVYYNSFYQGRVVEEEPNKNYFSLIWFIPKSINAWWELIRGIAVPYTKGSDYRESGVMRMFRVVGLLIAGVPAHYFQDYHNSTILGSSEIFPQVLYSNNQKTLKLQ